MGKTTLKFNVKFYQNFNKDLNSIQPGFYFNQKFKLGKNRLSTTFAIDFLFGELSTNNTITYKINNRLPIKVGWAHNVTVIPKFNVSFIDTGQQLSTRGIEKKISPSLTVRKQVDQDWDARLGYQYTRLFSRDKANFQYARHKGFLTVNYRF